MEKIRAHLPAMSDFSLREKALLTICAVLLVEPIANVGTPEQVLLQRIKEENLPAVLCINKIDTVEKKEDLLAVIAAYHEAYGDFEAIIPISAKTGDGLEALLAQLEKYAQPGPQLFPDGMTTDQPDAQVCAEILREKMLRCLWKRRSPTAPPWRSPASPSVTAASSTWI